MRQFIIAAAAVVIVSPSEADNIVTIRYDHMGCREPAHYHQLARLMEARDEAAAAAFAESKGVDCIFLAKGAVVDLRDFSLLRGLACVRTRGKPWCYWTAFDVVQK